ARERLAAEVAAPRLKPEPVRFQQHRQLLWKDAAQVQRYRQVVRPSGSGEVPGGGVDLRRRIVVHRRLDVDLAELRIGDARLGRALVRRARDGLDARIEDVERDRAARREMLADARETL